MLTMVDMANGAGVFFSYSEQGEDVANETYVMKVDGFAGTSVRFGSVGLRSRLTEYRRQSRCHIFAPCHGQVCALIPDVRDLGRSSWDRDASRGAMAARMRAGR